MATYSLHSILEIYWPWSNIVHNVGNTVQQSKLLYLHIDGLVLLQHGAQQGVGVQGHFFGHLPDLRALALSWNVSYVQREAHLVENSFPSGEVKGQLESPLAKLFLTLLIS